MQPEPLTEPLRFSRNRRGRPFWTFAATRAVAVAMLLAAIPAIVLAASPSKPSEYDVKAAYLLNFGKFVRLTTPASPRSSFDICTLGHDSMDSSLDVLAVNFKIGDLPVHISHLSDISGTKFCAIVFISATERDRIHEDLAILGSTDVLTVSDAPDFLQHGGMIQFVLISNHVRFAVNLDAVSRTHLVLSSELLRVASSVSGRPPTGGLP
ncbi:MAG TPA: YfiR family protein [Terracidiphilus sp.]|jgi:hypothetical protein|nr:YfiR family protein [Terracidiphilus sp.]